MKIAIDIREAVHPRSGKAVYTYEVVRNLLANEKDIEWVLYTRPLPANSPLKEWNRHDVHIKEISTPSVFWHISVMRDALREHVDVFFSPTSFIIPSLMPKRVRTAVTVHDMIAFLFPNSHQLKATLIEKLCARRAIERAAAILTPSENTKHDIQKFFKTKSQKIHVTPLGVALSTEQKEISRKDIILTVAGLEPRKNVARLIEAFEIISKKFPTYKLVIIGALHWRSQAALEKLRKTNAHIEHLQNVSYDQLDKYYREAKLFVFPSLYEGFGLPPLEAMARGCPVICSNRSSLPEVCGHAALYIDPENAEDIAGKMKEILSSEEIQADFSKKSLGQASHFTWAKTADLTAKALAGRLDTDV
ncbi:glycosyltransferase family 4 protein [Candidatus Gracilibacteria bacterium]|nr:glycosyltransferase family 4 protein [Candidatus Gracilibacteria bacterium]